MYAHNLLEKEFDAEFAGITMDFDHDDKKFWICSMMCSIWIADDGICFYYGIVHYVFLLLMFMPDLTIDLFTMDYFTMCVFTMDALRWNCLIHRTKSLVKQINHPKLSLCEL